MKTENKVKQAKKSLEDIKVNVKVKISALWVAIMALYIYNDYFSLYKPGSIEEMMQGNMGPFPVTQITMISAALLMAIPAVMIFLSLVMKPRLNRIVNIILGIVYVVVMVISVQGEWMYYIFMGVVEIILTVLLVWFAIKWPKNDLKHK